MGTAVTQANLRPADIIFTISNHVGIYIGNGQYIHIPNTGDVVKISNVIKFYEGRRLLK